MMVKALTNPHSAVDIFDALPPAYQDDPDGIGVVGDDLFKSLKDFLIIGKVIGLLPFSGVFGGTSHRDMTFKRKSFTSIFTHVIFVSLIFNAILGILAPFRAYKRNALEAAESIEGTLFYIWGTLLFLLFLTRGNQFIQIFIDWNKALVVYSTKDKTLRRDTLVISGVILGSAFLENAVLHMEYLNPLDKISGVNFINKTNKMPWLEAYYWRANPHWAEIISYNWAFALICFIQHKWILYAWNYVDICIAVFGRAMYFRFKALVDTAEEKLLGPQNNNKSGICNDQGAWLRVVHDHENLCSILDSMERFFSPLIFASYAVNVYYICLQLLEGLTSEITAHGIVHSIYAPWSFLHLVVRMYMTTIWCARINVHAHRIRKLLQKCPVHCYTTEISRLDKVVTSGPDIGLSGLGCFVVTKPFMLGMVTTVFTVEVVILQCVPHTPSH